MLRDHVAVLNLRVYAGVGLWFRFAIVGSVRIMARPWVAVGWFDLSLGDTVWWAQLDGAYEWRLTWDETRGLWRLARR